MEKIYYKIQYKVLHETVLQNHLCHNYVTENNITNVCWYFYGNLKYKTKFVILMKNIYTNINV